MFKKIQKRDGKIVNFNPEKITDAIAAAGAATEEFKYDRAKSLTDKVLKCAEETIKNRTPKVEQIQDIVEQVLMESSFKLTAKAYITYRQERKRTREAKSNLMDSYRKISLADASEDSDIKRSNANVDGNSAMGKMLQFGAEGSKEFAKTVLMDPKFSFAHDNGDIHIHYLDFYATGTADLTPVTATSAPLIQLVRMPLLLQLSSRQTRTNSTVVSQFQTLTTQWLQVLIRPSGNL